MMTIHKYGPLTLGEVAEWERVAQPTISRVVTRLESDGLVERTSDPNDGRVVRVGTTPAGAELFAEARARKVAWIDERLDLLGAQDRELIMAALPAMERLAALP